MDASNRMCGPPKLGVRMLAYKHEPTAGYSPSLGQDSRKEGTTCHPLNCRCARRDNVQAAYRVAFGVKWLGSAVRLGRLTWRLIIVNLSNLGMGDASRVVSSSRLLVPLTPNQQHHSSLYLFLVITHHCCDLETAPRPLQQRSW